MYSLGMRKSAKVTVMAVKFNNGATIIACNTTEAFASFRKVFGATPAVMVSTEVVQTLG